MCYFGIFKDVLSSLRKPCPGDCYFCPCLVVSAFQIGKWGFSSRVGNFFSPLPSLFQSGPITSKTALPPAVLQVLWAVSFVPLTCHQEKGCQPVADPVLTKLPSPAFLTWWDMLLPYIPKREMTYLSLKQAVLSFCFFFLLEEQLLLLGEFTSHHILHSLNASSLNAMKGTSQSSEMRVPHYPHDSMPFPCSEIEEFFLCLKLTAENRDSERQ